MIEFDHVTVSVPLHRRRKSPLFAKTRSVLNSVSLVIPSDRHIAVLGPSASDNSTLIDLLGGVVVPRKGRIFRHVKVSFPVGHAGSFETDLTVRKNVTHLARLYGSDVEGVVDFVKRASALGPAFDQPQGHLSRTSISRLASIVAYTIPFDVYVVNGGNMNLTRRKNDIVTTLFQERYRTSGMIISTRNTNFIREHCEMALYLNRGRLRLVESIEEALRFLRLHTRFATETDEHSLPAGDDVEL